MNTLALATFACSICHAPLTNGLDTFGDVHFPLCWDCYAYCNANGGGPESAGYYGLAPHHHDESVTGSIIGSTVFDPLPEPEIDGSYRFGNRTFTPDPAAPGLGFWDYDTPPGWR